MVWEYIAERLGGNRKPFIKWLEQFLQQERGRNGASVWGHSLCGPECSSFCLSLTIYKMKRLDQVRILRLGVDAKRGPWVGTAELQSLTLLTAGWTCVHLCLCPTQKRIPGSHHIL